MDIKLIKEHMAKPKEVELDIGGKEYIFKMSPVGTDRLHEVYALMSILDGISMNIKDLKNLDDIDDNNVDIGESTKILTRLTKDKLNTIKSLAVSTLKPNHEEMSEEFLGEIVVRNALRFLMLLIEQNMSFGEPDKKPVMPGPVGKS